VIEDDGAALPMEVSDERFTAWMRGHLLRAAHHFGLTVTADPVFGWRLRSIGAPVTTLQGQRWLRVVSDYPQWASGDGWTGNSDANTLTGLVKPRLLELVEWDDGGRRLRAELLTRLPGEPVSPADALHHPVQLPARWWAALRDNLERLRAAPTTRMNTSQDAVTRRSLATFGTEVRVRRWETVHGDLHWANLLAPQLGIVDWELWGRGPAGLDVSSLLCHSLLVPAVVNRVRRTFADILDTDDGRIAQLVVAARMLGRITAGDYPELEQPLRRHVTTLTDPAASRRSGHYS
jgi:hypothetical protein